MSDDHKRPVSLGKVEDQAVGERYQDRIAANAMTLHYYKPNFILLR